MEILTTYFPSFIPPLHPERCKHDMCHSSCIIIIFRIQISAEYSMIIGMIFKWRHIRQVYKIPVELPKTSY